MYQGFYTLASGMLTQNRHLNVISNNMINISTPGYKSDKFIASTFQEELLYRMGNKEKGNPALLNSVSMISTADEILTNYTQGAYEETGSNLDFAIDGNGFFQIQGENGAVYTRNGSFMVDDQGYLALSETGRVIGKNGPIFLNTDNITASEDGGIYNSAGVLIDTLAIVDFPDYTQLSKAAQGIFENTAQGAAAQGVAAQPKVVHKTLERSNVDHIQEFTDMMECQKALQSAAQLIKMYDLMNGKTATEIGRV